MRIMIDTNVLISIYLFPNPAMYSLITGDKDFFGLEIERPEILTPAQFIEKYI